jgi:hypothetical protein
MRMLIKCLSLRVFDCLFQSGSQSGEQIAADESDRLSLQWMMKPAAMTTM